MARIDTADPNYWTSIWHEKEVLFHQLDPDQNLVKYFDQLAVEKQSSEVKVFVPLCGKSVDMKWLAYEKGCKVVGVELVEKGVKDFFAEQNLSFEEVQTASETLALYQTIDKKIGIYKGDFFELNSDILNERFDIVWDRASLTSVNISDRERYIEKILSLMEKNGKWLLRTINYDPEKHNGAPHFVNEADIKTYFDGFNIEHLHTCDGFAERHKKLGLDWCTESLYVIYAQ